MEWAKEHTVSIAVDGVRLEGQCFGPAPSDADTLILLHEGLGSVALWRDFPEKLSRKTGLGVFAYSRQGYGHSDPVRLPRPLNYMDIEAEQVLPRVLNHMGFKSGFLIGHSDGASIAAIYAGYHQDERLKGIVLMAPHFFAEQMSVVAIAEVRRKFDHENLRDKLSKYHADVDGAFRGWCDSWLNPEFMSWNIEPYLHKIAVPILTLQGDEDEYGSRKQIDALTSKVKGRVDVEIFDNCGHSPHLHCPEAALTQICRFIEEVI